MFDWDRYVATDNIIEEELIIDVTEDSPDEVSVNYDEVRWVTVINNIYNLTCLNSIDFEFPRPVQ